MWQTRLFLHREINILCQETLFYPKICLQVFRTKLLHFFHYLPFYFRLNNSGNDVFSKQTKIYPQNSFEGVTSCIYYIRETYAKLNEIASLKTLGDIQLKVKWVITNIFAQATFYLQFKVTSFNPRVCWKLIYFFFRLSMNVVNFIGWGM